MILFVLAASLITIRAQFPRRAPTGMGFQTEVCTVLTGDTVYGTAGGDIVEHAAQPRERSSDTARGSGNPRDTASTSPSTLDRNSTGREKKNCDWRRDARGLPGWVFWCTDELENRPAPQEGKQQTGWLPYPNTPTHAGLAGISASRSRRSAHRRPLASATGSRESLPRRVLHRWAWY